MIKKYKDGILYIVTTQKSSVYLDAAIESARSVLALCPNLGRHVYTDNGGLELIASSEESPFSSAGEIVNPHYRSKVDYIAQTPFERTLYLDSDTKVVADISEMFDLLNRFDLALAHAHKRNSHGTTESWREEIPPSFPQYNGGVILYRKVTAVKKLLKDWGDSFHEAGFKKDQVTLRELLWLSDLRLATLPPEYNIRYEKYLKIWNAAEATPKILHMSKFNGRAEFGSRGVFDRAVLWIKSKVKA